MQTFTLATAGLFVLAASAADTFTSQVIKNYCHESVIFTYTNGTGYVYPTIQLKSAEAYITGITGTGNSFGITKSSDYFNEPKIVLGSSVNETDGILYWAIGNAGGDPMAGESFNVTSTGGDCGQVDGYDDGQVHACSAENMTLTLSLC